VFYEDSNQFNAVRSLLEEQPLPPALNLARMRLTDADLDRLPWERIAAECTELDMSENLLTALPTVLATGHGLKFNLSVVCFAGNLMPVDHVHAWMASCADVELASVVLAGRWSSVALFALCSALSARALTHANLVNFNRLHCPL
jgi:Leucine-rich repeat (LRR) protein